MRLINIKPIHLFKKNISNIELNSVNTHYTVMYSGGITEKSCRRNETGD